LTNLFKLDKQRVLKFLTAVSPAFPGIPLPESSTY
jgi:hypothetical protein